MELGYTNIEQTANVRGLGLDMEARVAAEREQTRAEELLARTSVVEQAVVAAAETRHDPSMFARLRDFAGQVIGRREVA